jgi:hypothetical protein
MASDDLFGPDDLFTKKTGDHRFSHYAASDERKAGFRWQ